MGRDTFQSSARITCVILGSGKALLLSQREAGTFLMDNHRSVRGLHPASMQPFAETCSSGRPEKDSTDE